MRATKESQGGAGLSLSEFIDTPLDRAIFGNIAFFLFAYTPYFSQTSSVSIHLPSRRRTVDDVLQKIYQRRFGLRKDDRGSLVTYDNNHGMPLIRGWLHSWGFFSDSIGERILAVILKKISVKDQLADFNKKVGSALHFIADWAAGFVAYNGQLNTKKTGFFRKYFQDSIFNETFYSEISRGDVDLLVECFRSIVVDPNPDMSRPVFILCRAPVVQACNLNGKSAPIRLQISEYMSTPQEHLWLWAIYPHIAEKAKGKDLVAGLYTAGDVKAGAHCEN
jgi:hypothetical protein